MIKTYFNFEHQSPNWRIWSKMSECENIQDTFKQIEKYYTLIGISINFKRLKFYDTNIKEFVSLESPWKVGLNEKSLV